MKQQKLFAIISNFLIALSNLEVVISEEKEYPGNLGTRKFPRSTHQGIFFLTCISADNSGLILIYD